MSSTEKGCRGFCVHGTLTRCSVTNQWLALWEDQRSCWAHIYSVYQCFRVLILFRESHGLLQEFQILQGSILNRVERKVSLLTVPESLWWYRTGMEVGRTTDDFRSLRSSDFCREEELPLQRTFDIHKKVYNTKGKGETEEAWCLL